MESCGADLANSAVFPELLARLMENVAESLDAHARWVGNETVAADSESRALRRTADSFRAIRSAALEAVATMRGAQDLPPAPHDPSAWDQAAFAARMQQKIALQRELASTLLRFAELSEQALDD